MYIPIITYHSVAPVKNTRWIKQYLTLELKYFEEQMKLINENHYKTIFLEEYFDILNGGYTGKEKFICINFDDGFLDNWSYAFPVLKKYGFKATIFVSPEFVDSRAIIRKNLDDYRKGNASEDKLFRWGYLSWEEMFLMESSGLIDIQSHTMSHSEFFISDEITDFHHPGSQYLSPIGNLYPDRKPYYIEDPDFEKLLPYGYPFFRSASSVIAKRVYINPDFTNEVVKKLKNYDWSVYDLKDITRKIEPVYRYYKKNHSIITRTETDREYDVRLMYELKDSKDIIEKKLNKRVKYLCWPNIKYNEYTHLKAREVGYDATVIKLGAVQKQPDDRFARISIASYRGNNFFSNMKTHFKLKGMHLKVPFSYIYLFNQRLKKIL